MTQTEEIVDEVIAITGSHIKFNIKTLLLEGENEHWYKSDCGELSVIGYDGEL